MDIENITTTDTTLAAALEEAKAELIAEEALDIVVPWYIKIRNLFCRTVKTVVKLVCSTVQTGIIFILNNEENQTLAKLAVITAMKAGLKGENAWEAAWKILNSGEIYIADGTKVSPKAIPQNVLETLLQLVYTCVKNQLKV